MERIGYEYIGEKLKGDLVAFVSNRYFDREKERAIALSAIEASLSGFDIATDGDERVVKVLVDVLYETGRRLYSFTSDIKNYPLKELVVLTGGGIVKPSLCLKRELLIASSSLALFFSPLEKALLFALDNNIPAALSRVALNKASENLLYSGIPMFDSFSNLFEFPEVVAYQDRNGCIRTDSFRFHYKLIK